jgi:putative DNA primase/helicase
MRVPKGAARDYITKRCAVVFDPAATCPNWLEFQNKIAGRNKELVAYKQRVFGLLLTGRMVEILFIFHGDGQNGKSTELETIHYLLGEYAHAADAGVMISPHDQSNATPEIVALKGKRAVFINETNESDHLNESRVKYLTGDDTLSGRELFSATINFRPTHKALLRTNHKPKIRGTDLGIWRRIHYLPYFVTITAEEKIDNFRQTVLEPEGPGILNWMLEGLTDYLAGGLRPPPVVFQATEKYRREMDTVGQWVDMACEPSGIGTKLFLSEIHEIYAKWATAEHSFAESRKKLAEALRGRGYPEDKPRNLTRFEVRIKEPGEPG